MNKVMLVGRAGKDAEIKTLTGGIVISTFSLATTKKFKGKSGETEEKTSWHSLKCFGRTAEIAAEYVFKGKQISIVGEIEYSKYENKDGVTQYKTEIVVDELELLSGGPKQH